MNRLPGSFRDPSGYVYEEDGEIFRAISSSYRADFEHLIASGLGETLLERGQLVPFQPVSKQVEGMWKAIRLERVPFVSYPYEWCFSQLKDAALAMLDIQAEALRFGMSLKDASAYNIQFRSGKPILIDHLSFERLDPGRPWKAYRQFVMHFLDPLALMAMADVRHGLQLRNFIDGIPLDYATRALPKSSWLRPGLLLHLHLHSRFQRKHAVTRAERIDVTRKQLESVSVSGTNLKRIAASLQTAIEGLKLPSMSTEWGAYYDDTNYSKEAFEQKKKIIDQIAEKFKPDRACDLGANNGEFSRILARHAETVISADVDPVAVERNYQLVRKRQDAAVIPVLQDLCNPSPGLGWAGVERASFLERARCDLVMGLALIHHLCIGNNTPLAQVAEFFFSLAPIAVVEFVPKADSQVQRLLASREDIFEQYDEDHCVQAFLCFYRSVERIPVPGSERSILVFRASGD